MFIICTDFDTTVELDNIFCMDLSRERERKKDDEAIAR